MNIFDDEDFAMYEHFWWWRFLMMNIFDDEDFTMCEHFRDELYWWIIISMYTLGSEMTKDKLIDTILLCTRWGPKLTKDKLIFDNIFDILCKFTMLDG